MTLQFARLFKKVNRNFDVKRQTGASFPVAAKAFDTLLVKASSTS
jgi:hypothetical protein